MFVAPHPLPGEGNACGKNQAVSGFPTVRV